jgi:hypothetical protein
MIRDRAMMTVNGGLLFVYFIGMIVRLWNHEIILQKICVHLNTANVWYQV